jgi:hypothetical protein
MTETRPRTRPNTLAWVLPTVEWFRITFETEADLLAWVEKAPGGGEGTRLDVYEGR